MKLEKKNHMNILEWRQGKQSYEYTCTKQEKILSWIYLYEAKEKSFMNILVWRQGLLMRSETRHYWTYRLFMQQWIKTNQFCNSSEYQGILFTLIVKYNSVNLSCCMVANSRILRILTVIFICKLISIFCSI